MSAASESSDRVTSTFTSLDRVVRIAQVSEAAESYVGAVFDGTQDWAHVLESVRVGFSYLGRGGDINLEKGRQILLALDTKLDTADVVFKTLFPRTADDDECRSLFTKSTSTILEINELAQKVRGHVPNPPRITIIQEVCNTISLYLSAHEADEVPVNTVMPFSDAYKPLEETDSRVKDTIDRYVSTYNAMMPLYKADQISQVRANVIRQLEGKRYQMEDVPDPFTKKFNTISFEDILYSTEQSPEVLSRTILSYLAGMPKGDVYWESMRLLFLLPPRPQEQGDEKFASFSWNLLLFQKWVSEKLVFPSFRNLSIAKQFEEDEVELAREDPDFDTKFSQIMDSLSPLIARYYAFFLYDTMTRGPKNMCELNAEVSIDDAISVYRITELASALQSDQVTPGIFIAARAVHTTLAKSMHRILPDWTERFTHRIKNKRGWNPFVTVFTEQVHRDLDTEQATTLNRHLDQN
jgi:hypothetical protein